MKVNDKMVETAIEAMVTQPIWQDMFPRGVKAGLEAVVPLIEKEYVDEISRLNKRISNLEDYIYYLEKYD